MRRLLMILILLASGCVRSHHGGRCGSGSNVLIYQRGHSGGIHSGRR